MDVGDRNSNIYISRVNLPQFESQTVVLHEVTGCSLRKLWTMLVNIYMCSYLKKKKRKVVFLKINCLLINVSLKMIKIIFKLTSYQFLFFYCCCCFFSTGKLGNLQEQIFCQFCQTHAKTKRKIDRNNL